jgi:hypothetical protein
MILSKYEPNETVPLKLNLTVMQKAELFNWFLLLKKDAI